MYEKDKVSQREAFGQTVHELARENDRIVAIAGDGIKSFLLGDMEKEFPDRTINIGIAECNAMMTSAGLASEGFIPFVSLYAVFASMRALEQVRTFICYPELNVKIVSGVGGLAGSSEGTSHQGTEDLSIMRSIANLTIVVPADAASTKVVVRAAAKFKGPVYIRLGSNPGPKVFDENYKFEFGKANLMKDGKDVSIICIGTLVHRCVEAREILEKEGVSVRLIEMPTIKPIDEDVVLKAAKETGAIVTAEESNILGGLGGAVAEILGEKCPTIMKRIGIPDSFGQSGTQDELMDYYGMSVNDIVNAVKHVISKK